MSTRPRQAATPLPLVIIGNGGAAAEAVLALRTSGYRGEVHLFSENEHAPYNPTLGPYLVGGILQLHQVFPFGDRISFYERNGVTAHPGEKVTCLDPAEQTLVTSRDRSFRFERCLVASGARPSVPPVPGLREALATAPPNGGRRVFTLRSLADALALKEAVIRLRGIRHAPGRDTAPGQGTTSEQGTALNQCEPPRAVVIGASLAGVKVADVLHYLGFQVSLVERETHILPLCAHPECAAVLEEHLTRLDYDLRLGITLEAVIPADYGKMALHFAPPQAASVLVDLVVVCTGSRPALDFLVSGSVETATGILVDEYLRSSHPAIYAAGDVAQGLNLLSGRREIIALWSSARRQGRAAGCNLAGAVRRHQGDIAHNITKVGKLVFASAGCACDYDDLTCKRKGEAVELKLWKEGRLVGINLLNSCLQAGILKQALLKAAAGLAKEARATWMTFGG